MSAPTPSIVDTSSKANESAALVSRSEPFLTIATVDDYEAAGRWLVGARSWIKGLWQHFDPGLDAIYQAWKTNRAQVSAIAAGVEQRAEAVDIEMKAFRRRQDDIVAAENRRLAAEAQERERAEREVAALMAAEEGDEVQAEAIRTAPSTAPPVQVTRSAYVPPVAGLNVRKEWKSKITDLRKLGAAVGRGDVGTDCLIGIGKHAKLGHLRSKGLDGLAKAFGALLTAKGYGVEAYEADITVTSGDD